MCNLYRMTKTPDEVAGWFNVVNEAAGSNLGAEVYPGYPGLVVADGALRQMGWGFPLSIRGAKGQALKPKPVNNARTDKLQSAFWRTSFERQRCLIPLSAWAEAEGTKGSMTRSWLSVPDAEIFAAAGLWRRSDEWGDVFSMIMTDAVGPAAQLHSRMPVLIARDDYPLWLSASPEHALGLCKGWDGILMIERTSEPWSHRR